MRKWLVRVSVLLNITLALAATLLWFNWQSIVQNNFLKPGYDRWTTQFEVLSIQPGDIVFLGDSITEGGIWEELFPGLPTRNRGIGGDVTEGVLERLEQVTQGTPAKVFLLIGTNDLALSEKSPDEIAANIEAIVDAIRSQSPGTRIYVQSVLPRGAGFRAAVEALNRATRARISTKANWIDLYPLFLDTEDGSIRDEFSNDELHLMGAGYLNWRDAIAPHVHP